MVSLSRKALSSCPRLGGRTCGEGQRLLEYWGIGGKATARGFEPLRAEPNGFLVHHLSHSVTLSWRLCRTLRPALLATATIAMQGWREGLPVHRCGRSAPAEPPTQGHHQGAAAADDTWPLATACTHRAGAPTGRPAASERQCRRSVEACVSVRQRGDSSPCGQSPMDF